MLFQNICATNHYVVHPDWSSFHSENGILLGEEVYEHAENMAVHLFPRQGVLIAAPKDSPVRKGDTLYFTWNGVSFNRCVSPIDKQNIFVLNNAQYAYKQDGEIHTLGEFVLLKPVVEDASITESGIILNAMIIGAQENAHLEEKAINKSLYGEVVAISSETKGLKIGDRVTIGETSDVNVKIDGEIYYRTRTSEILYIHER